MSLRSTSTSWVNQAAVLLASALLLGACGNDSAADLIASGKAHLAKKEPRSAIIQFKTALQKDGQSGEARYLLGNTLLETGEPVAASVELGRALDLKYAETQVLPPLARALLLSGQTRKLTNLYGAVELADKAAAADLKSSVASAWGVLNDRAKTEEAVAAALRAVPQFGTARILQARLAAGQHHYDEATKIVEDVLAREPQRADGWHLKGEMLWYVKGDLKAAEEAFRKALAIEKAFVPAHGALIALSLQRRDFEAMKAQVEQLKAVLPKHPQTRFAQAQLAFVQHDYKTARENTQILLRVAPEHVGTLQLAAAIEFRDGSLLLAESYLNKALQINPKLPVARRMLAQTYLRLGQPPKALAALQPLLTAEAADAEAVAMAAEAHLQLNDPRRAEALFIQAEKLNPDDPRIRTALALTRLAYGDTDAAFTELEAVAAQDKSNFADMALISARLKRNEYEAALQAADALAKKQPKDAAVFTTRGRIQTARKDSAAARADFERALVIDPLYFPAAAGLAVLDLEEKKPEQARKRFDELLRADPRNYLAMLAIADVRARAGAPNEEIVQILANAIQAAPSEAAPRLQLIDLHLRTKNFKAALVAAQDALAALPNHMEVLDAAGRAQLEAGDLQQAVSSFRRLAGANPLSALPHLRLADTYVAMRDKRAAENSLKKALEIQPDLVAAQRGLIEMALAENRPRDALEVARSMQKQRPKEDAGYLFEGEVHLRLKNPDAAISAFRAGLQQKKSPELATRLHGTLLARERRAEADQFAAAWEKNNPNDVAFDYHLASVALVRREYAQAETRLNRVVARQPNNALAHNNLAWLLLKTGHPGAAQHAEKANQLLPNRPALMDTLAMALAAENQLPRALEIQKKAVERAPDDLGLRLNLARLAVKAGDKVLARTELDKLARQGKRFTGQDEVSELLKTL